MIKRRKSFTRDLSRLRSLAFTLAIALLHSPLTEAENESGTLSHKYLFAPNKTFPYFEACGTLDSATAKEFSPTNAAMLAQCSLLVYVKENEFIEEKLRLAHFTNIQFFDTDGTFAFLAEGPRDIVITFRGSETGDRTDYLTDAKFHQRPFTADGKAHPGFAQALEQVDENLRSSLKQALEEDPSKTVWATGHSLGAALATLFSIQNPDYVHVLYPIGSPRVVNRRLAQRWHNQLAIFRVVNNNDLITRLPTPPFYEHIGPTFFLAVDGELVVDPPSRRIWRERLKGQKKYVEQLLSDHWSEGDFSAIPSDSFADHSPRLYAEALIRLASK